MKRSWDESTFDGTYANAKKQSVDLITYKNTIKREWITENRELNALLGNIQTKLVTYNLIPYTPPEGLQLSVILFLNNSVALNFRT